MIPERIQQIQDIIGTDAGGRGMKSLIVQGDLLEAARKFSNNKSKKKRCILLLSGFPCCVKETPPTETDGPPGTVALARAAVALGYDQVVLVTDDCNRDVFAAALAGDECCLKSVQLVSFPAELNETKEAELRHLADKAELIIACERAGPASDGNCYTMRGTNMQGLVAPLHLLVEYARPKPFLAIGDGGNELGMGKVYDPHIIKNIPDGSKIGCVVAADHLVAASVSNWGGYALAAAAGLARAEQEANQDAAVDDWVSKCLPREAQEVALLDRCVAAGCRDGVSGKMEATVDGMPLETSMQCLRDIRCTALGDR